MYTHVLSRCRARWRIAESRRQSQSVVCGRNACITGKDLKIGGFVARDCARETELRRTDLSCEPDAAPCIMNVVQQYKTWVRNNSNLLGAIEGSLSSLTWLLPDRFSGSELNLEALNSLLGLLGLFHESILQEPVYQQNGKQPAQWPLWLGALQQVSLEAYMLTKAKQGHMQTLQQLWPHRWKCWWRWPHATRNAKMQ